MFLKTFIINQFSQVHVWEITESFEDLFDQVYLKDESLLRLNNMKSELHQRGFLSIRLLLQQLGYNDDDLYYDEFGKPHLRDGKNISISHSFHMAVVAISEVEIGVDIEMIREKISIVAHKFSQSELNFLDNKEGIDYIKKLTVIWGCKESIFKIQNEPGISFKDHIDVFPFELNEKKTNAILNFNQLNLEFELGFEEISDYMLVYATKK